MIATISTMSDVGMLTPRLTRLDRTRRQATARRLAFVGARAGHACLFRASFRPIELRAMQRALGFSFVLTNARQMANLSREVRELHQLARHDVVGVEPDPALVGFDGAHALTSRSSRRATGEAPAVLDIEASGFGRGSFRIEVGFARKRRGSLPRVCSHRARRPCAKRRSGCVQRLARSSHLRRFEGESAMPGKMARAC